MFKKLFNKTEQITNNRLSEVCEEFSARVYPKIRIADVFLIENSGLDHDLYNFSLKSHFDFTVYDCNDMPLFAIEFDGPTHNTKGQSNRDQKKNALCKLFRFPLLRINNLYLERRYRDLDLVAWFINVWFLQEAFLEAQEKGDIAPDENFDPMLIVKSSNHKNLFPFWLSWDLRLKIQKLYNAKKCLSSLPSEWIGVDKEGNYRGIAWLYVNEYMGVFVKTGMQSQLFPINSEIISEVLCFQVYEKLITALNQNSLGYNRQEINDEVLSFTNQYELRASIFSEARVQ